MEERKWRESRGKGPANTRSALRIKTNRYVNFQVFASVNRTLQSGELAALLALALEGASVVINWQIRFLFGSISVFVDIEKNTQDNKCNNDRNWKDAKLSW